ncbi:Small-subunit processome, Utp11 [Nannochloropsis gaditana]|uniref:Small-subunit processome, Utp11 n=1 Tax=Nannochloropsis gaditana TaxID=72520 RepID=W7TPA9_9STRA|nr:Small-subunit processome, Utp11 [Nannochloropsis gaditana]
MPYASLRNAIPRKTNKERSQPAARKKFGLLEKHKDYVQRANDYKRKTKALASLREKAAFRNPDEFYFAMTKGQTKEGVHRVRPAEASLPHDHIALLKTQDMRYVNMKRALDVKKAEKLQAGLHFLTEEAANKHTVFVDTEVPPSLPPSLLPSSLPFLPLALPPTRLLLSFPALQTTYIHLVTDSFYRHPTSRCFHVSFLLSRRPPRPSLPPPRMLAFPSPPAIAS